MTDRINELAARERELVATNNNGCNDTVLYRLRKELDTLRRKQKRAKR